MAHSQSNRKGQFPMVCQICENDTKIKWKCLDCDKLMCVNCKEKIHPKFAKDHKIIDTKEIGLHSEQETKLDFSNIKCKQHQGQVSCLFCKTCDHLVCPVCVSKVHKRHDLVEICEGYEIKVERLKKGLNKFKNDKMYLRKEKDRLDGIKMTENSSYYSVKQSIVDQQEAAMKTVQHKAKKLIDHLGKIRKTVNESIDTEFQKNESMRKQMDENVNQVQSALNNTNISEFFDEVVKMEHSLNDEVSPVKLHCGSIPNFSPGDLTVNIVGVLNLKSEAKVKPQKCELSAAREYTTSINNVQIISLVAKSIWIYNSTPEALQKVKPTGDGLLVMFSLQFPVHDMAVTQANDLLLCVSGPRLKLVHNRTGEISDSKYTVGSLQPTSLHVTRDGQVIVGAWVGPNDRKVVIIMDKEGQHETIFESDKNNRPIFRYPRSITTTKNGNIFVADCRAQDNDCKVIVLGKNGDLVNIYAGHSSINAVDLPFRSETIKTTPSDNVIAADMDNNILHVLDNSGNLLKYYKTKEKGILYPCSLAFDTTGQLYIGCSNRKNTKDMAKMYILNIPGI